MSKSQIFVNKAVAHLGKGAGKFRKWYYGTDLKGVPWCANFVSYVANEAGILNVIVKKCEGAGDFPRLGVKAGWGKWYEGGTIPQSGDIILFTWNGKGRYEGKDEYFSDHVGIVEKVSGNTVHTIEGNSGGTNDTSTVCRCTYNINSGLINGYYRPDWSKTAAKPETDEPAPADDKNSNTPPAANNNTPSKPAQTLPSNKAADVTYRVRTRKHGWLDEVKNLTDYAGWQDSPITDIAVKVSAGTVKYRVHIKGGGWLSRVTGYNIKDAINGYAGNGKAIDAIEVYYETPNNIRPYKKAVYRVSPVGKNFYDWQHDNEKTAGQDGYAGAFGKTIDRLQIVIK